MMNMGIERMLKEKFGYAFKEIRQVFEGDQPPVETTPEVAE
jgi:NFU1 iron-sulfur cluster scaffold homolog, mitochondrial